MFIIYIFNSYFYIKHNILQIFFYNKLIEKQN